MSDPKTGILDYLATTDATGGRELREYLGVGRQALSVHFRQLIESGDVLKSGSTRAARYSLPTHAPAPLVASKDLGIAGLDESEV